MAEFWSTIITLVIGGIVTHLFAPVFVTRFSKTKQQKNIDLALQVSQISEKTAAQLYQKLERIDKLEARTDQQEEEIKELQEGRAEREGQIKELQAQNEAREVEIAALNKKITEGDAKYQSAKRVIERLVKALKDADIAIPDMNGDLIRWYQRVLEKADMKLYRRPSRLELWLHRKRREFEQYDLEALVNVSLGGIIFVWFVYVMIFKPVMP